MDRSQEILNYIKENRPDLIELYDRIMPGITANYNTLQTYFNLNRLLRTFDTTDINKIENLPIEDIVSLFEYDLFCTNCICLLIKKFNSAEEWKTQNGYTFTFYDSTAISGTVIDIGLYEKTTDKTVKILFNYPSISEVLDEFKSISSDLELPIKISLYLEGYLGAVENTVIWKRMTVTTIINTADILLYSKRL